MVAIRDVNFREFEFSIQEFQFPGLDEFSSYNTPMHCQRRRWYWDWEIGAAIYWANEASV